MNIPLTPQQVQQIAGIPLRLIKYSSLCNYKDLSDIFGKYKGVLLLYETKLNFGHWVCLIKQPKVISFFDSYAFMPDDELQFTNIKFRRENNMDIPFLTHLMYYSKYPIDYNDHQMQKFDKNIQSCGRHVGYRLRHHKLTNDEYLDMFKHIPLNQRDKVITDITENYLKI